MSTQGKTELVLSPDKALLVLLVGGYFSSQYLTEIPQLIPGLRAIAALLLMAVGLYLIIDLIGREPASRGRLEDWAKIGLVSLTIFVIVIIPTIGAIYLRRATEPHLFVHDGLIQSEAATNFVVSGFNPYSQDYTNTPMADWPFREGDLTVNPALFYYPYMPLTFLLPLPIHLLGLSALGWFDHRILYLALFIAILALSLAMAAKGWRRYAILIALGLNPLFVPFLIEGRNDVLVLFWIVIAIFYAQRKQFTAGAVFLAFGCATKQLGWFFVPAFFVLIGANGGLPGYWARIRKPLAAFLGTAASLIVPWLWLNPSRFIESTIAFQSGLVEHGYPIGGFGLSSILLGFGILESNQEQFPFWILQLTIVVPLAWFLLHRQAGSNNVRTALTGYGILLFAVMFFSRSFNDNHAGYVLSILVLATFISYDSNKTAINR